MSVVMEAFGERGSIRWAGDVFFSTYGKYIGKYATDVCIYMAVLLGKFKSS